MENNGITNVTETHGEQSLGGFMASCARMMIKQDRILVIGVREDGEHLDIDTRAFEMDPEFTKGILARLYSAIQNGEGTEAP